MTSFEEAQERIVADCAPRGSESIGLLDGAGRILARDIIARDDLVPFARSAMDGFAVRAIDLERLPVALPVRASAYAAPGTHVHQAGTATAVTTGAPIPAGADCVIPIEHVALDGVTITIAHRAFPGECIFPPGDDARRGDLLLARGSRLTPAGIALLAAAGEARLDVYRRPSVTIVCGGDELVDIDQTPGAGQIRDSNGPLLAAAFAAAGAVVAAPLRLADDRGAVRDALIRAFETSDLVVTAGGASVGERDYVKRACADLGVSFAFDSVALRPAKPTAFGRRGDAFVCVLPGNPAAAFVGLHEFALPAARALSGDPRPRLPRVTATLAGSIHAKPGRHFAAFAAVSAGPQGLVARPLDNQCSSLTRTAAAGAGFIVVPPGPRTYVDGERVEVDVFDWSQLIVQGADAARSVAAYTLA